MTGRVPVAIRGALAFGDYPPPRCTCGELASNRIHTEPARAGYHPFAERPPIVAQESADLEPADPIEALAYAVDTVISAWAYMLTASHGRRERRDGRELLGAAMGALIDARRQYREATE